MLVEGDQTAVVAHSECEEIRVSELVGREEPIAIDCCRCECEVVWPELVELGLLAKMCALLMGVMPCRPA